MWSKAFRAVQGNSPRRRRLTGESRLPITQEKRSKMRSISLISRASPAHSSEQISDARTETEGALEGLAGSTLPPPRTLQAAPTDPEGWRHPHAPEGPRRAAPCPSSLHRPKGDPLESRGAGRECRSWGILRMRAPAWRPEVFPGAPASAGGPYTARLQAGHRFARGNQCGLGAGSCPPSLARRAQK